MRLLTFWRRQPTPEQDAEVTPEVEAQESGRPLLGGPGAKAAPRSKVCSRNVQIDGASNVTTTLCSAVHKRQATRSG